MSRCFSMLILLLVGLMVFSWHALAAGITETKAAIGKGCKAEGEYSTAMGYYTTAKGLWSTAMGNSTIAGQAATAMGALSQANGNDSFATGTKAIADGASSTAMGYYTTAGGDYSTAMGYYTEASGLGSIAMGDHTTVGGEFSFAYGRHMALTDDADHTFVWGYSDADQSISASDAFLIFPAGTPGKVGIGTTDPKQMLHMAGNNPRILIEASSSNPEINFKNAGDDGSSVWALYKDSSTGDLKFYQGGDKILIQNSTGNFGIGLLHSSYKLMVAGNAAKSSGGTSWSVVSDARLKDITGEYSRGLDAIVNLRPVTFFYKNSNPRGLPSDEENIGFIAQEVQEVFPEAVSEGSDGYLDFNMHPVSVAMVNAIKELKAENEALKADNAMLKKEIQKIKVALGL